MYYACMKRKDIQVLGIGLLAAIAVMLLIAAPSHPECGTVGIDYMPCGYIDRVGWTVSNGGWQLPLVFVAVVYIVYLIWKKAK